MSAFAMTRRGKRFVVIPNPKPNVFVLNKKTEGEESPEKKDCFRGMSRLPLNAESLDMTKKYKFLSPLPIFLSKFENHNLNHYNDH